MHLLCIVNLDLGPSGPDLALYHLYMAIMYTKVHIVSTCHLHLVGVSMHHLHSFYVIVYYESTLGLGSRSSLDKAHSCLGLTA